MSDPGIIVAEGQGDLEIDGYSVVKPVSDSLYQPWTIEDLSSLWGPPAVRGANTLIPGIEGRYANPRRVDETTYQLIMHITGAIDQSGTPYSDPVMGLATNLDYLWDNVASPPTPPDSTRSAVLTMPDDTTRDAEVQVQLQVGDLLGPYDKAAVLVVTVPAGRFVPTGS